ncbi:MAG: hypothetical protein U0P82_13050 [Vicinamibacterales bacterium]
MTTTRGRWWLLLAVTLLLVCAWPPLQGRSLLVKGVNWIVDPGHRLPVLPPQLGFGLSDDPQAVEIRDELVRRYDELYNRDTLTRWRLQMKVAHDPFDPSTERQILLVIGVIAGFMLLRPTQEG